MDKGNLLKRRITASKKAINKEFQKAFEAIVKTVKECGGVLKTPACTGKITLYAFYEKEMYDSPNTMNEAVAIQGLRWDEELGLCICTNDMLRNYQFDTQDYFDYFFDFEGEDLERLNKVLADPAYYVEIDKNDLDYEKTILSIIKGLADYL